jgi:signal peptidase I
MSVNHSRRIWVLVFAIASLNGLLIGFDLYPLQISAVSGESMTPTLHPGDILVTCRWCPPTQGNLVLVDNTNLIELSARIRRHLHTSHQEAPHSFLVKRVAALPGQPIPSYSEQLWKNYKLPVNLKTLRSQLAPNPGIAPAGHIWLLGDNPLLSIDSRFWGAVPIGNIRGSIIFVWKFSDENT